MIEKLMNKEQIITTVEQYVLVIRNVFNLPNFKMPNVGFFSKSTIAGKAWYASHSVEFNEVLAAENGDAFVNTIIHELAHLVTNILYPNAKQAHGPEFKSVMLKLNANPSTYHRYNVESVKQVRNYTRYVCTCGCSEHLVTKAKAERAFAYVCNTCRQPLKYTGVTKIVRK